MNFSLLFVFACGCFVLYKGHFLFLTILLSWQPRNRVKREIESPGISFFRAKLALVILNFLTLSRVSQGPAAPRSPVTYIPTKVK